MAPSGPDIQPDDGSVLTPDVDPAALAPRARPAEAVPAGASPEPAAPEAPPAEPDAKKLAGLFGPHADARHVALVGLFLLAVFYTLQIARSFILPIVLAVLLDFMLSPLVRWLKRMRIPEPLGAGLVIVVLLGGVSVGMYQLSGPAAGWIARAPASVAAVRERLEDLRGPVERVTRAAEQVQRATDVDGNRTPEVEIKGPSLISQFFGGTASFLGGAAVMVFLTYFLLAAGDLFLTKLVTVLPQFQDKKKAVKIAREVEAQISSYLFVTTVINAGVGVVTGFVLYLLGMPNPVLWGVVAGVLNFVPYIGALANLVLLTLAAFVTFPNVGQALAIPAAFLGLNLIESNLVTPMILGRRMRLNTVAVFVGLVFWWYLWGVAGAILAVPILATLKIVCDHIESLASVGEFLAE